MNQPYSDFQSNPLFAQPAQMKGGVLDVFAFVADPEVLDGCVRRRLDEPTEGVAGLRALAPIVLATFAHYQHASSLTPPYDQRGFVDYHELALWVFAVATRDAPNAGLGSVFVWNPYLYVDNHLALIGGRELYGFEKKMGDVVMPAGPGASARYAVSTLGYPVYTPDCPAQRVPVMTVERVDAAASEVGGAPWGDLAALLNGVLDAAGHPEGTLAERLGSILSDVVLDIAIVGHILADVLRKEIPGLTLKQTRSAFDPLRADLKLLLNTSNTIQKIAGSLLVGDYVATLPHSASEPIARDLGLSETPKPLVAFRVELDGIMGTSSQVWP